jgi:hypothetical protein
MEVLRVRHWRHVRRQPLPVCCADPDYQAFLKEYESGTSGKDKTKSGGPGADLGEVGATGSTADVAAVGEGGLLITPLMQYLKTTAAARKAKAKAAGAAPPAAPAGAAKKGVRKPAPAPSSSVVGIAVVGLKAQSLACSWDLGREGGGALALQSACVSVRAHS